MPLTKSASKAAFKKNIKKEVKAGKPVKQAVAIAYAVKRDAQAKPGGDKKRLGDAKSKRLRKGKLEPKAKPSSVAKAKAKSQPQPKPSAAKAK